MTAPSTDSASFGDLAAFAALPRLTGLALAPDGGRLVAAVQGPDPDGAKYASALWEIPLDGGEPHRLTHSASGEAAPAFRPDGSLAFTSKRPRDGETDDEPALWALPLAGEAGVLARRPGGLNEPRVASRSGAMLLTGARLAGSGDADDAERRAVRKDRGISAILHTGMPVRYWDHDLDDTSTRLLFLEAGGALRDLAPNATTELYQTSATIDAAGTLVATGWRRRVVGGGAPSSVVLVEVAAGTHRDLATAADGVEYADPVLDPHGRRVALAAERQGSFEQPPQRWLEVRAVDRSGTLRIDLGDVHATEWIFAPDGATLYVAGDHHGSGAVLAVEAGSGGVRTVADDAVYTALQVAPDGATIYALRSTMDTAPAPVRLDVADGAVSTLPTPAPTPSLPGECVELWAVAGDGARVHGYLCHPHGDAPAPVMLWIHGGPFGSFNGWNWRWNPWVAVARGWAVVLPDPAMSTGYGTGWLERGWPYVAADVFADCEAVLDEVLARPDVDPERVACLGASFGGYLTNWVAGHAADRFRAIVTHAGLWSLDQEHATTDAAHYKTSIFGRPGEHPQWYAANSPDQARVGGVPMLITHGSRDFRVPISEALRLWWELVSTWAGDPVDLPHRFLQLTGENHWVLSPANVEIWYDAVLGFCAEHVLSRPWTPSPLL